MATYTPMIMQYLSVKADYEDAFLFFRLGDFYEMFFEDAVNAARELEITLTSRDAGAKERIPMCGVPYHAAANYIEQLVSKGYKVAICEQTEDPKQAKGVVKREVVQVITPGTVIESKSLTEKENNYIASITDFGSNFGFVYCDLSTGQIRTTMFTNGIEDCFNELALLEIKELVLARDFQESYVKQLKTRFAFTMSYEDQVELTNHSNLIDTITKSPLKTTVSRLINYLLKTQKRSLDHLQPASEYETNHYLKIDYFSKKNLELTETIRFKGRKGSLLWLLDETMTAMGARMMKNWIDRPLLSFEQIMKRQTIVEILVNNYFTRMEIRELLKEIYDLERLAGRIAFGNVNAKDLIQMKRSLSQIPLLKNALIQMNEEPMSQLAFNLDTCEEVFNMIEKAIMENPPLTIKEGEIIKDGYNEQLDQYRYAMRNGKDWIAQLEAKEREKTGIKSLKIGYNRVFGYYIEVTKANLHLLTEGQYDRKQTLSNAERFITPELKEKETLILEAQEKSVELEYELFIEVRQLIKQHIPRLQKLAAQISELDCYVSMAHISEERNYVKPNFSMDRTLEIIEGRHPVVEKVLERQGYVPNDCKMNHAREQLLITGPNMSGKSTYMRQIALSVIMAQIGCFVPATEATLPIFDSIFTRIGAADDLIAGQSTFMVEMLEARNAIVHATKDSLILFDEIGRGTSTYDGMALAQSMIEYIHDKIGAKTLFSTHYHELTDLSESLDRLVNVHVSAMEQNKKLIFLHKIKEGPADQSYGIHVAQLAELPEQVIQRATEILEQLEAKDVQPLPVQEVKEEKTVVKTIEESNQLSLFDTLEEHPAVTKLKELNIYEMTPMDAMNAIYEIKKLVK